MRLCFLVKLFVLHLVLVLIDIAKIVIFLFFFSFLDVLGRVGLVGRVGGPLSWMFSDWSDRSEVLSLGCSRTGRTSLAGRRSSLAYSASSPLAHYRKRTGRWGVEKEKKECFFLSEGGAAGGEAPMKYQCLRVFRGETGKFFLTREGGISFSRAKRCGKTKKGRKRASGR